MQTCELALKQATRPGELQVEAVQGCNQNGCGALILLYFMTECSFMSDASG